MSEFQQFFEGMPIVALLLHGETVVRLTKAASALFGDHYLNRRLSDFLPPAEASLILEKASDGLSVALYGIPVGGAVFDLQSVCQDRFVWLILYPHQPAEDSAEPPMIDLAIIGRQIRAPLTPMLSALSLLSGRLEPAQNEKNRRYFASLLQNCFRLLRLSNNLVEFPQYVAGNMRLYPIERDLAAFSAEVFDSLAPFAAARELKTKFEGPNAPLHASFDEQKIERLLYNLFSNALKNTPPGGRVTLSVWSDDAFAYLRVADDGQGIPSDRLADLFRPPKTWRPGGDMPGLGLSIVRMIAELHGGTVMLESRQGKGSTVTVTLRRDKNPPNILRSYPAADYTGEFSHALVELSDSIPGGHPLYGSFGIR